MLFSNILVYLQVLVMFFIVPLFGVVILGMLWKRATPRRRLLGIPARASWPRSACSSMSTPSRAGFDPTQLNPDHVKHIALSPLAKDMAVNMFGALWSLLICVTVTVVVSLLTRPKADSELTNLVYGLTPLPEAGPTPWYESPKLWAGVVGVALILVNIIFW